MGGKSPNRNHNLWRFHKYRDIVSGKEFLAGHVYIMYNFVLHSMYDSGEGGRGGVNKKAKDKIFSYIKSARLSSISPRIYHIYKKIFAKRV